MMSAFFFILVNNTFIVDVHLGKLARMLRLLGIDTVYSNKVTPQQLITTAKEQHRTLLSRYAPFAKELPGQVFLIASSDPLAQLQQLMKHFPLKNALQPFTRCLVCNGHLGTVSKEAVAERLQPNTSAAFDTFWQCDNCKRIYWEGSHYERMLQLIEEIKSFED